MNEPTTAERDSKVPGMDVLVWNDNSDPDTRVWLCYFGGPSGCVFPEHEGRCPIHLLRGLERKLGEARKLLEGLEWAGEQAGEFVCPECYAPCPQRTAAEKKLLPPCDHNTGCALAAFLKASLDKAHGPICPDWCEGHSDVG